MSKRTHKEFNGDLVEKPPINNKKPRIETSDSHDESESIKKVEEPKREFVKLSGKIETLDDLIKLAKQYDPNKDYNINLKKLHKLLPSLEKLHGIIGMKTVKDSIVNQIIFFLNEFDTQNQDMLHTVIQGPPGVGKTTLGKIIGELYYYMDVIKPVEKKPVEPPKKKLKIISLEELLNMELENYMNHRVDKPIDKQNDKCCGDEEKKEEKSDTPFKFKIVKRADLVGRYLGETSIKTTEAIKAAEGGVLFIDEAYSLGNPEGRDSFAKECIDCINQHLSEEKSNLLCIIAGYQDALDKCFFAYNEGLRRRFPFVYTIEKYTAEELCLIYKKMIKDMGWEADNVPEKFFKENYDCFTNQGGDVETLVFMTKISHSRRTLFEPENKKKISKQDLEDAFKVFKINKELKEDKEKKESDQFWKNMYI